MSVALDRQKLAKVLEMLRSPHDGERLSAVARANEMLERAGLTWTQFCAGERGIGSALAQEYAKASRSQRNAKASRFDDAADAFGYGAGYKRKRAADAARASTKHDQTDFFKYAALARQIALHEQFVTLPATVRRVIVNILNGTLMRVSDADARVIDFIAKSLNIIP